MVESLLEIEKNIYVFLDSLSEDETNCITQHDRDLIEAIVHKHHAPGSIKRLKAKIAKRMQKKIALDTGVKKCTTCGETKPFKDFPVNSKTSSGVGSRCRACKNRLRRKTNV
jgi:hypothetical protein